MYQVIKRDGRKADFDLARIAKAITKAFDATKIPYNTDIINLLALQVTADYAGKVKNNEIGVEDIQDSVEAVLQRAGYAAVAKSYILYRRTGRGCVKYAPPCWTIKSWLTTICGCLTGESRKTPLSPTPWAG